MWYVVNQNELYHHGIKGQKWGVRRFQNPDGTLTEAGKKRYGYKDLEKMSETRTDYFARYRAFTAANRRGRAVKQDAVKNSRSVSERLKNSLGATGVAKKHNARADVFREASDEMERRGRMDLAIEFQAISNNNRNIAIEKADQARTKNLIDRYAKEQTQGQRAVRYSKVGRKYVASSEYIKNVLTYGLYTPLADKSYSKKLSQEERLAITRFNDGNGRLERRKPK